MDINNIYYLPEFIIHNKSSKTICHNCPGLACKSFDDKQLIHKIPTAKKIIKDCATCIQGDKCSRTFKYHRHACLLCEVDNCNKTFEGVIHK